MYLGKFPGSAQLAPGQRQDREGGLVERPFGTRDVLFVRTNTAYRDRFDANPSRTQPLSTFVYDYGALFFTKPFNGISTYMPLVFDESASWVNTAGYPKAVQGETDSRAQWHDSGNVVPSRLSRLLEYEISVSGGNSGGPVWTDTPAGENQRVVAITALSGQSLNGGPRLVSANRDLITEWMRWTPATTLTPDTHGDTTGEATLVAVNSSTPGDLESAGDIDYFRLILPQAGTVTIWTTGSTDTVGTLQRRARVGAPTIATDDNSGTYNNFRINTSLSAGEYYIRVRGHESNTGPYTLGVSFTPASDTHGNTTATATPVGINSSTPGVIAPSGDTDYFRFDLTQDGIVTIETTGNAGTVGTLITQAGKTIVTDDNFSGPGDNFRINTSLSPGTYFIEVRGRGARTGSYTLGVSFAPLDFHGNTPGTATAVGIPSSTSGAIWTFEDEDYFRIVLTRAGTVTIETTGDTDTEGTLTTQAGSTIGTDSRSGLDDNFRIVEHLSAGTYFIKVHVITWRDLGSYTLHVSLAPASDMHGDTRETATLVGIPSSTPGFITSWGDTDYFRLVLTQAETVTIWTTGSTDTTGTLQGPSGPDDQPQVRAGREFPYHSTPFRRDVLY